MQDFNLFDLVVLDAPCAEIGVVFPEPKDDTFVGVRYLVDENGNVLLLRDAKARCSDEIIIDWYEEEPNGYFFEQFEGEKHVICLVWPTEKNGVAYKRYLFLEVSLTGHVILLQGYFLCTDDVVDMAQWAALEENLQLGQCYMSEPEYA